MSMGCLKEYKTLEQELFKIYKKRRIDIELTVRVVNGKGVWVIKQV